jgi:hypothetical protein
MLFVGVALGPALAYGKRSLPAEVPPVVDRGVRYEAPHFDNPCGQNGGCIVAYDEVSGGLLWSMKVYCTQYDPQLERDVQDVFITSLAVENGRLDVSNEKGNHFAVDLRTRAITGDAGGCSEPGAGGCVFSPSAEQVSTRSLVWGILAVLGLMAITRRHRRRGSSG